MHMLKAGQEQCFTLPAIDTTVIGNPWLIWISLQLSKEINYYV